MSSPNSRMPLIDAFRAIAALFVLLHHFVSYFPMSDTVWDVFPVTFEWFCDYGGMAVQVFLVIGGFLAARTLSVPNMSPLSQIGKRYIRLVVPYLAAISLAILAVIVANPWLDHWAIPARPTAGQLVAHVFLLQNVLGFDSLSAGVWYVAIDFQLFAATAFLLWIGRGRIVGPILVLSVAASSLFWFNLDDGWDDLAVYFFGSYGLGAAAWWASDGQRKPVWMVLFAVVAVSAILVDFRGRLVIALVTALTLGFSRCVGCLERGPSIRALSFLGKISYSLFLTHFPILLLSNAFYVMLGLSSPLSAMVGLLLAFIASIGFATLFYNGLESPVSHRRIASFLTALIAKIRSPGH